MNIINSMNIQILIVNIIIIRQYDVVGWLVMGLSEKSGWGLEIFNTGTP